MSQRRIDLLSLTACAALGLTDGMLGTAWPAMRHAFHVPVGDLGLILLVQTVGSVLVSGVITSAIRRVGLGAMLGTAAVLAGTAAAGYAVAPVLAVVLSVSILFGVANGSVDAGLNAAIGTSGRSRLLNLLHGAYGVGTTIGPLLVTAAMLLGSWRGAYFVLIAAELLIAWQWFLHSRIETAKPVTQAHSTKPRAPVAPVARAPVILGVSLFFVYTGIEVAAGQWETVFDRDHLHMSAPAAGVATFAYWGALTIVRISLALVPRPPSNEAVVRASGGISVIAAAGIWLAPAVGIKIAAFVVLGGALAGVFPALVALTPNRVGNDHAARVIAWQMGAAAAGGAGVSAIIGLLINAFNLGVLGPALTVLCVVFVLGSSLLRRFSVAPVREPARLG